MKKRLYTKTGGRIKEARTSNPGLTQKLLAKEVDCTTDYIAMLERGEKPLTEGMAYKIAKSCGVLPEFLLLKSDKPNVGPAIDIQAEHDISVMWNAFIDYVSRKDGYEIERVQSSELSDDFQSRIVCTIKKGNSCTPVSSAAVNKYFEDIADYSIYKLRQMIEKEGAKFGKYPRKTE